VLASHVWGRGLKGTLHTYVYVLFLNLSLLRSLNPRQGVDGNNVHFSGTISTQVVREWLDPSELEALLLTKEGRMLHNTKLIPFLYKHWLNASEWTQTQANEREP